MKSSQIKITHISQTNLRDAEVKALQKLEIVNAGTRNFSIECQMIAILPGQFVNIKGVSYFSEESEVSFNFTGKVESVQQTSDSHFQYDVELHQYDKVLWTEYLDSKKASQKNVDRIFKVVRGEDG